MAHGRSVRSSGLTLRKQTLFRWTKCHGQMRLGLPEVTTWSLRIKPAQKEGQQLRPGDKPDPQIMTHPKKVSNWSRKRPLFLPKLFFLGLPVTCYRRNADGQPGSLRCLQTSLLLLGGGGGAQKRNS